MASEDIFEQEFSEDITHFDSELQEGTAAEELVGDEICDNGDKNTSTSEQNQHQLSENATSAVDLGDKESKLLHLPIVRIRNLMKLDPDLRIANGEAVFLVTKATELFIESLARESYTYTAQAKKKTVQKRDVEMAIAAVDSLMFLDGAMNF